MNKNRVGLTMGVFVAFVHLIWLIGVALGIMQGFLDWIFPLHMLSNVYTVLTINWLNALLLLVMAFVGGYVFGWVFAWLWNKLGKK